MRDLDGQVALVTGAGSGLGAAIATALAADGAHVVVADLVLEKADACVALIREATHSAEACSLDVGSAGEAAALVERVLALRGRLDVLVNNAAVDFTVPADELAIAEWERAIRTNLSGPYFTARAVIPAMKRAGHGHIVNICSTASRRAWPNAAPYHASKWGLLGLSHALHAELRPAGIKVTAVLAGGMRTPFLLDRFPDIDVACLQDPANVAEVVRWSLKLPAESVMPEVMVLPMRETSWP